MQYLDQKESSNISMYNYFYKSSLTANKILVYLALQLAVAYHKHRLPLSQFSSIFN